MSVMVELTLPFPPSVNRYYRNLHGRTLISAEGRAYKELVGRIVQWHRASKQIEDRIELQITLHPPDKRRRDIDNSCKAILDSLQKAGVFLDDSQVDRLFVERGEIERPAGSAVVVIKTIGWNE